MNTKAMNQSSINTQPILVTGASSGIGEATVLELSQKSYTVYAGARSEAALQFLGGIPNVLPLRMDVTKEHEILQCFEEIRQRHERLYGLVNNAGILDLWPLAESTTDDILRILNVNLLGLHSVTQAMLPLLRQSSGRVINISSTGGVGTVPGLGAYNISKHAVEAYSDVLRQELADDTISVSIVEPGTFQSNIWTNAGTFHNERDKADFNLKNNPTIGATYIRLQKFIDESRQQDNANMVAQCVATALSAPKPSERYLVTPNQKQASWVVNTLMSKIAQLNSQSNYPLSHEALHAMLTEALIAEDLDNDQEA